MLFEMSFMATLGQNQLQTIRKVLPSSTNIVFRGGGLMPRLLPLESKQNKKEVFQRLLTGVEGMSTDRFLKHPH